MRSLYLCPWVSEPSAVPAARQEYESQMRDRLAVLNGPHVVASTLGRELIK